MICRACNQPTTPEAEVLVPGFPRGCLRFHSGIEKCRAAAEAAAAFAFRHLSGRRGSRVKPRPASE